MGLFSLLFLSQKKAIEEARVTKQPESNGIGY